MAQRPSQTRVQRLQSLGLVQEKDIGWDSSRVTRKCLDQREVPETSLVSKAGGRELSDEVSPGQERMKFNFPVGKTGGGGFERCLYLTACLEMKLTLLSNLSHNLILIDWNQSTSPVLLNGNIMWTTLPYFILSVFIAILKKNSLNYL